MLNSWFFETLSLRPAPCLGECLSGYLLRLAEENAFTKFWHLAKYLFPSWDEPDHISMLKWEYPLRGWGDIPLLTNLATDKLSPLTILPWVEKFRKFPGDSYSLAQGNFFRSLINPHLRVCPGCLDIQPFIRLIWRLLPVTVCVEHGCFLQEKCSNCGNKLIPISQASHHMCCAKCGFDLRRLSASLAPQIILEIQASKQKDFHFLLDPHSQIVEEDSAKALGLKFRYIREQSGLSREQVAQKIKQSLSSIKCLESGTEVISLSNYLLYLDAMQLSWREFAKIEVPDLFVQRTKAFPYFHLRVCPNAACANHKVPSNGVVLRKNLPEKQRVRFHCNSCGRDFTRAYDGNLTSRWGTGGGTETLPPKSKKEIARLIKLGRQGLSNKAIAQRLGWGEKTVRMYWISLGLVDQIHKAQAKQRAQGKSARQVSLRSKIRPIMNSVLQQDREATLRQVCKALGTNADYLHSNSDEALMGFVSLAITLHNDQVRQSKGKSVSNSIIRSIRSLSRLRHPVKIEKIVKSAGLSYKQLSENYPELHSRLSSAIQVHRERIKKLEVELQIKKIDETAVDLIKQGEHLTYRRILLAAGLSPYADKSAPIRGALKYWVPSRSR